MNGSKETDQEDIMIFQTIESGDLGQDDRNSHEP